MKSKIKNIVKKSIFFLVLLTMGVSSYASIMHTTLQGASVKFDDNDHFFTVNGTDFGLVYNSFAGIQFLTPCFCEKVIYTIGSQPGQDLNFYAVGEAIDGTNNLHVDASTANLDFTGQQVPDGIQYFGFKTTAGNNGWIKVDITRGVKLDILEYAYESVVDKSINVGDTGAALGLATELFNTTISIFPNPSSDSITINTENGLKFKTVAIYSFDGKIIAEHTLKNSIAKIDVSTLSKGSYLLVLTSENGKAYTKKWIKK